MVLQTFQTIFCSFPAFQQEHLTAIRLIPTQSHLKVGMTCDFAQGHPSQVMQGCLLFPFTRMCGSHPCHCKHKVPIFRMAE